MDYENALNAMDTYIESIGKDLDDFVLGGMEQAAVEAMQENKAGIESVEKILRIMEKYPDLEFGTPGALTHYMEKFYSPQYVEMVKQSILRTPTVHTLWLWNRIINGAAQEEKKQYITLLKFVSINPSHMLVVRQVAKHFYDFQQNK